MALLTSNPKAVRPGAFLRELIKLDAGVQALLPAGQAFPINGVFEVPAQMHATLQGWITVLQAVDKAKQVHKGALTARLAITIAARTFTKGLKSVIKQQFGQQSIK